MSIEESPGLTREETRKLILAAVPRGQWVEEWKIEKVLEWADNVRKDQFILEAALEGFINVAWSDEQGELVFKATGSE